jgi:two-component system, LytTR family, sensor kinase
MDGGPLHSRVLTMTPSHAASLVNITGFIAGTVLYAMLFAMVVGPASTRDGRGARGPIDRLLLLTALLGLIWNVEAFVSHGLRDFGVLPLPPLAQALGLAALGLLPAVVVHSVLRGGVTRLTSPSAWILVLIAYTLSASAAGIQIGAAVQGTALPAVAGLRLLTYGFVALVVPLAIITRRQPGARRALWLAALGVFAVSAFHLSQQERLQSTWFFELIGHHASLPIALSILYQAYPFALADVFLKRAIALVALMGLTLGAYVGLEMAHAHAGGAANTLPALVVLSVALGSALLYPFLMQASTWFVDTIILHRVDYELLRSTLARRANASTSAPPMLDAACDALAPALSAATVTWTQLENVETATGAGVVSVPSNGNMAEVLVPTTDAPQYAIHIRDLRGGRRLLSDDIAMLEAVAQMLSRRIDSLRIEQERYEQRLREQDIRRLASEAELRALRAQINPHFLFNALTTVGYLIGTAPERALQTLLQLTELLRRVLRSDGGPSTLGQELALLRAYLEIEQARFEERLVVEIDVPETLADAELPPLLVQPLVENAIKHGIAPFRRVGRLALRATVEDDETLVITVWDSGPGLDSGGLAADASGGVGLRNVEERLARAYGAQGLLRLTSHPGHGTTAELRLPFVVIGAARPSVTAHRVH